MSKALQINNLRKTYANGFTALKGVSLDVEQGDFFALLGGNGAGKSTMIGIISSLVNKTDGDVKVCGFDLETQRSQAKSMIGLVPQEFNINMFEPVDEILINQAGYYGVPRKEATIRARQLLEQLELWDKRKNMARELSGGMKRRLMIARALIHRPKLLILDEPTAGVDIEIRRSMWDFLTKLNTAGMTIILTTHYLEEAESMCRNIAIINKGEIVKNTSMKTLLSGLNHETFILDLKTPVTQVPHTDEFTITLIDESTLEVELSKDFSINRIFEVLNNHDIRVNSMRNKSNRLEELFLEMVHQNNAENTSEETA
ncbi:ABC transporter ATP-binding protein [Leucothrix arctica]|uniref:ABC transporter n=1 Tax=Leucothrix arctica TaxID=1481894 RepID=A0A317CHH4_9GAMM|nr:ABC transporter ATP-binding protein [Leucothrix arctica]PWQ97995.1 ABC transporter [Leucothrix arctica]